MNVVCIDCEKEREIFSHFKPPWTGKYKKKMINNGVRQEFYGLISVNCQKVFKSDYLE